METKTLSLDGLRELHRKRTTLCVSVYMKTHRTGAETQQDPIRFKNLVNQVHNRLQDRGLLEEEAYRLLKPLTNLERDLDFWQHQREGLAIFISEGFMRIYRLPIEVEELQMVAYRFQTQPIVRLFFSERRFFVLALGLKAVRLFTGNSYSLDEVNVQDLPEGLRETLARLDVQRELQTHSAGGGHTRAVFHGHDPSAKDKIRIEQYFRDVSSKIEAVLCNETAPLLLYGVGYLVSIYKTVNGYSNLMPEALSGSSESIVLSDLYRDAKLAVEPYLQKSTDSLINQYHERLGTGLASASINEIVPAARNGRLQALLINKTDQIWGILDTKSNKVKIEKTQNDDNEDLINMAVAECILNGGVVATATNADIGNTSMGAIFRC